MMFAMMHMKRWRSADPRRGGMRRESIRNLPALPAAAMVVAWMALPAGATHDLSVSNRWSDSVIEYAVPSAREIGSMASFMTDMTVADVNGNGRGDLVGKDNRTSHLVIWFNPGHVTGIWERVEFRSIRLDLDGRLFALDANGNGVVDVVDRSGWYENFHGDGRTWVYSETDGIPDGKPLAIGDLRADGTGNDIVFAGSWTAPAGFNRAWPSFDVPWDTAPQAVAIGDIDGDGRADLVCATPNGIVYYRNEGQGRDWTLHSVSPQNADALLLLDVDGDGKLDIVATVRDDDGIDRLVWLRNAPEWPEIYSEPTGVHARGMQAADMDGDGLPDIVLTPSYYSDTLRWWRNPGKPETPPVAFSVELRDYLDYVLLPSAGAKGAASPVGVAVSAAASTAIWAWRTEYASIPAPGGMIGAAMDRAVRAHGLRETAPAGQGMRYFCGGWHLTGGAATPAEGHGKATSWFNPADVAQIEFAWLPQAHVRVSPAGPGTVSASATGWVTLGTTLNLDAHPMPGTRFTGWEGLPEESGDPAYTSVTVNVTAPLGVTGTFERNTWELTVRGARAEGVRAVWNEGLQSPLAPLFGLLNVTVGDADGAGQADIIAGSGLSFLGIHIGQLAWWRLDDGADPSDGGKWRMEFIAAPGDLRRVACVTAANVDGGAKAAIVMGDSELNQIRCYRRDGTNWTFDLLPSTLTDIRSLAAGDIGANGARDIVGAGYWDNKVVWWENRDARGTDWEERLIDDQCRQPSHVLALDLNNNGRTDVAAASYDFREGGLYIWLNRGNGADWEKRTIKELPGSVRTAAGDFNANGSPDLALISFTRDTLGWAENRDDATEWIWHPISTELARPRRMVVADINGDGLDDIVVVTSSSVYWFENLDGGMHWQQHALADIASVNGLAVLPRRDEGLPFCLLGTSGALEAVTLRSRTVTPAEYTGVSLPDFGRGVSLMPLRAARPLGGAVREICSGWTVTGSSAWHGEGSATAWIEPAGALDVAFRWQTQYWVRVHTVKGAGRVRPASGWQTANTEVRYEAIPDEGYLFASWEGAAAGAEPETTVAIVPGMRVSANFFYEVPLDWLGRYGWNDPDNAARDHDGDGTLAWEEFIAGTCPTNRNSVFKIMAQPSGTAADTSLTLSWPSFPGRVYDLVVRDPVTGGQTDLMRGIAAEPPTNSVSVPLSPPAAFYGVRVYFAD